MVTVGKYFSTEKHVSENLTPLTLCTTLWSSISTRLGASTVQEGALPQIVPMCNMFS